MVSRLRIRGRGKPYDCIMGLSGGVDSSYLALLAVRRFKLRPLVVHVDAGWNSEVAVGNIQRIVHELRLDLHTKVIDWTEMRELQRAYLLAGVANQDVPQDHAFFAALYSEARAFGICDILTGGNLQSESILPTAWGHDAMDSVNLLAIHSAFGRTPLKQYPIHGNWHRLFYKRFVRKMNTHRPLDLMHYNKFEAKEQLKREVGWRDYGGKHYESIFTKFFQAHYLPARFGYDKRLAHLSSLIVSGQIDRDEALEQLKAPLYRSDELEQDLQFVIKKLDLTREEFDRLMNEQPRSYREFRNSDWLVDLLRVAFKGMSFVSRTFRGSGRK